MRRFIAWCSALLLVAALAPWTAGEKQVALGAPFWRLLDDAAQVRAALE